MLATAALLVLSVSTSVQGGPTDKAYEMEMAKWREDYATRLERPEGWLSVAGLFWLKPGANLVGSGPGSQVVLPERASPPIAGTMTLRGGKVSLNAMAGVELLVNDKLATRDQILKSDADSSVDRMKLGYVTFKIIKRGDRVGVRLYDPKCQGRMEHRGLHWYKVDPAMKVAAKFMPYDPPKMAMITNVLGDKTPSELPGYLVFTVNGKECRLDAEDGGDVLFLNFQDMTSGKFTYPAGRFLDVPKPDKDGNVVIDFNQATCPPCAYTGYATCPLPPDGNRLEVAIEAGERKYHG